MPKTHEGLPFGLERDQPGFDRVTDLARDLFGAYASALVVVHRGRMWRTADPLNRFPRARRLAEQVIRSGASLWIEALSRHPLSARHPMVAGGTPLQAYVGAPIVGADGTVLGVLSVVGREPWPFDAARLKSLEQLAQIAADDCDRQRGVLELKTTQDALAAFVRAAPAAVMVTDRDLRVLHASPMFLEAFGIEAHEARGRSVFALAPDDFEGHRPAYERCLNGEAVRPSRLASPQRDGSIRYMQSELTPWRRASGEIGGLISTAMDITDLVEALAAAERVSERLKLAVDLADLHVWEIDYLTGTVETEGSSESFFDAPLDLAAFIRDTNITIDPRDRDRLADEWRQAVESDRAFRPEYRTARSDGREVWATCNVKLVRDEAGQPRRLVGAMQNITERKHHEAELLLAKAAAEAANQAKTTFLATISHEIRTPLNGVLGMAQAMAGQPLSEAQRERLSVIQQSGQALLAVLNDMLDLSKIEAGRLQLETLAFDLTELARSALAAFAAVGQRKGLELRLVVEPEAAGRYRSDPARLRQILNNLLSNAIKFTEAGEVVLQVAREGGDLLFTVRDTGIGMAPAVLERLFQKFEQADAATTRRFGGTGLGLSICRELAGLLGGTISAESAEARGSSLQLRLPLTRLGDEAGPAGPAEPVEVPLETSRGLRVLAAEDNAVNQLVLSTLLRQFGIEVTLVNDGAEAVAAWARQPWDLVLMDAQMPVMDGLSAAREIRAREARSARARTPIVALTADAMSHQVAAYLAAGMDGFVAKPIEPEKLIAAVAAALETPASGDQANAACA